MGRGGTTAWRAALVVAVVVQLVVLYAPSAGGAAGVPHLDKLVHAAVFAAVAVTGRRAGLPAGPLLAVLLGHAVLSEVLQGALLPGRSGDPLDAVADAAGAVLGLRAARTGESAPRAVGAGDRLGG
ncbi:VanZ family protein [Vallicoccus soli]|uniref:VanZ family protein n=1 Tax=Vallicoccus soli TaxID=2339232 RepID=UPI0014031FEE|nr:VanZ family protein [Vallicoccus soli]